MSPVLKNLYYHYKLCFFKNGYGKNHIIITKIMKCNFHFSLDKKLLVGGNEE